MVPKIRQGFVLELRRPDPRMHSRGDQSFWKVLGEELGREGGSGWRALENWAVGRPWKESLGVGA